MKSRYLLGVSAVALVVAMTPAKSDEILSSDPGGAYIDFPVTGNLINPDDSILGLPLNPPEVGLNVDAPVSGDIINDGSIFAEEIGIDARHYGRATINNGLMTVDDDETEDAEATGIRQYYSGSELEVIFDGRNTGDIIVTAEGEDLDDDDSADATAYAYGIRQDMDAYYGSASASASNSGDILVTSTAEARGGTDFDQDDGEADAEAYAHGIDQQVDASDLASGVVVNSGFINVSADAEAIAGGTEYGYAAATADAEGINQYVNYENGGSAASTGSVTNTSSIVVASTADARGADDVEYGYAQAWASATGIDQHVDGGRSAFGTVTNGGSIAVTAAAQAHGGDDASDGDNGYAYATASADALGVHQRIYSGEGPATGVGVNNGAIVVSATADAFGGDDPYDDFDATTYVEGVTRAEVEAEGWTQDVYGDEASATATNNGTIMATAVAKVTGGRTDDEDVQLDVEAEANAEGINQNIDNDGGAGRATATNAFGKTIVSSAEAQATAFDYGDASASADATGINQFIYGVGGSSDEVAIARATNDGTIAASAKATAKAGDDVASYTGDTNEGDPGGTAYFYDGPNAYALAYAFGIEQATYDQFSADFSATNTGLISVEADALAEGFGAAVGDPDYVYLGDREFDYLVDGAVAVGMLQSVQETGGGDAFLVADNTNSIEVRSWGYAEATGELLMDPYNGQENEAFAGALGIGILQSVEESRVGDVTASNSGSIEVESYGYAESYDGYANAEAQAFGILQDVVGTVDAFADATNDGEIDVGAWADAEGEYSADAYVYVAGIAQYLEAGAISTGIANATNNEAIYAYGNADAEVDGGGNEGNYASATATVAGIDQWVEGPGNISLMATNNGYIEVGAGADAGTDDDDDPEADTYAEANAYGVWQVAEGAYDNVSPDDDYEGSVMSAINDGGIYVTARARAEGGNETYATYTTTSGSGESDTQTYTHYIDYVANAEALAVGIYQDNILDSDASNLSSINNSGSIYVEADAEVDGWYNLSDLVPNGRGVGALAQALGTIQDGNEDGPETFNFDWRNSGEIMVDAGAYGYSEMTRAVAIGAQAGHEFYDSNESLTGGEYGLIGQTINLDYLNESTGTIFALANVEGYGYLQSLAIGMNFQADGIVGTIRNDGAVIAFADGDRDTYGDVTATATATAIGVNISADVLNGSFTNTGVIGAVVDDGDVDDAYATALRIGIYDPGNNGYEMATIEGYNEFTVTNDGGILVAGFTDGDDGDSYGLSAENLRLGNAINLQHDNTESPWNYGIDVELKGTERDGFVIGNVVYNNDEQNFTVSSGRTQYLGQWSFDDAGGDGGDYTGNLTVVDGGTFHLLNRADQYTLDHRLPADRQVHVDLDDSVGNAMVYVDDFTVEEGGVFSVGLGPNDGTPFFGHVFANTADVEDGTLKAHFIAAYYGAGFGERNYEDVLVAGNNFGTFADIVSNTPLMQVWDEYDGTYTADIVAQRVAFDEVEGLTENQRQVAAAIEDRYDDLDDEAYNDMDDFEKMIARLFTLDGDQKYKDALDMFSAEPYAATMSNMLWSFGPLQWILADRLGGGGAGGAGPVGYAESEAASSPASDAIITGSIPSHERASLWVRPFGSWGDQKDGSSIALAHTTSQYGIYGGGDVNTGNATLGLAGGYISSGLNFQDGSTTDYSGFQIAGYGRVDMGALYLRGVAAGGFYENKGTRVYDGGSETANAEYGSRAGSVYGEVGFNGLAMANMSLTPFAGAGYTFGSSDAFTETGTGPGNLNVDAASGSNVVTSLGAQWNAHGAIGDKPFRTSVRVAWEHRFGDGYAGLNANFANPNAPDGIGFTSTSGNWANDFAVVGASGTMDLTPATEFTLRYDGRFSADFLSNTVSGTLRQKF